MTKLHVLGIPHTRPWHTHCAFTGKVVKFPRMMTPLGYEVHYYGIDGDDIGQSVSHPVMSACDQSSLLGHDFSDSTKFHGDDANIASPLYVEFNRRLGDILESTVNEGDVVLYTFGTGHAAAYGRHKGIAVESGIGYPETFLDFRIYESYAWYHWHCGKYQRHGSHYNFVIPNYFVSEDWTFHETPSDYVLYFGRLNDLKGLQIVVEMAKRRPSQRFIICGQGDPTPYLVSDNIEYLPPVIGQARNDLLGNAKCVVMPSLFIEPFGGVAVEAMLSGTPVLTTSFGAFTETVEHGKTGYRCHTLGDFLSALDSVSILDRRYISDIAHSHYSLESVGPQYDRVFRQLLDLYGEGWYGDSVHSPLVMETPKARLAAAT